METKTEILRSEALISDDKVSNDAIASSEGDLEWTEEEEAALRHRLDWHIVPLVTFLYLLCFLDRANIGNARIQGMAVDLHLNVGYRFNWALSIFYMVLNPSQVYLTVEVPSNILLKRIGPRIYIPLLVAGFGLVSLLTSFVRSFTQLCVARAFLGLFEGGVMPGIAFVLSCFYRRQELYFRVGLYVSASSLAGAFGGLLATGLARVPEWGIESMRIHTWRNIFFFEGLFTVLVGLAAPWVMPTSPETTWFLSARQRYIASERLRREFKAHADEKVTLRHIRLALLNINNWICALGFFLGNITVQGMSLFIPTILADLGWTATRAQLYSVPPYVLACLLAITVAYVSDRTRMRGLYLAMFTVLVIAGFAVLRWETDNANVKYMAVFLVAAGAFPGGPGFLSWGLNNASGPAIRAVSGGWIVTIGTVGGIVATWSYTANDAPLYHTGHEINLGGQIAALVLSVSGIAYCLWENKQRALGKRDHRLQGLTEEQQGGLGYRHPEFRYMV